MPEELKKNVVNMKRLSQDIEDPIVVNAADANGRTLEVIFTQEAAAQLTPDTKVYLSWYHQQKKIKGYNVFTYIPGDNPKRDPYRWQIFYPQSMLYCGDVLACIELVDDVSIAASNNFMIHVLEDPNDGSTFVVSDDFSEFKTAVIALNSLWDKVNEEFEQMQEEHQYILQIVADNELEIDNIKDIAEDIQSKVDEDLLPLLDTVDDLSNRVDDLEEINNSWTEIILAARDEAVELSEISVEKIEGESSDDFFYRYNLYQGGNLIEDGTIDIYKGMIVTGGEVIQPTSQNPIEIDGQQITSGTYIQINIENNDPLYIDVEALAVYNTFNDTDEIVVTDNNHSISLNINKILASKIIYKQATASAAEQTVAQAIDALESKTAALTWGVLPQTV